MKIINSVILCIFSALTTGCSQTSSSKDEPAAIKKDPVKAEAKQVTATKVTQGVFYRELISNGKTHAIKQASITFPQVGEIKQVNIKNGTFVKAGQLLALMDDALASKQVKRTREAMLKARVELDDRLIDFGYRLKDSAKVPQQIMQMAKIKSGYNTAVYDYQDAQKALQQTRIAAPFAGKVANLEAKAFNNSNNFRQLCTLLDTRQMLVLFNVLESEYKPLAVGTPVNVIVYGERNAINGRITAINPIIDANGLIAVTAEVDNARDILIDGMNVEVTIKDAINNQLFIPKKAVVQRQDRKVVFVYEKGKAKWYYVETGLENREYICITSGLKAGQIVITSNNFNLAHDADVKLVNP
ncbi:efflux RND transporter periplasmic adaptor subunit [Pelobium manganitolerans]|uniref:efflux RND transporter periplasmic adaptor subunit n=1 Tax=Pelobium manganitolerans TaxID=1842495 RepID=UPI003FA3C65E